MSTAEVFDEAYRQRRRHEFTLTSVATNVHYYGAPAYAKKRDIWPPLASEVSTEVDAKFQSKITEKLFSSEEGPPGLKPSDGSQYRREQLYQPLYEGFTIRLIELRPGRYDDSLSLSLYHIDLQADHVPYEALSYCWGRSSFRGVRKSEVMVDGHQISIPANLEQALRHLRFSNTSRLIWADSICIDQSDMRERGHQVSLMSNVYRDAIRVIVWLSDVAEWERNDGLHDVEDVCAEQAFGAICDVVNEWLGLKGVEGKASYQIFERDKTDATIRGGSVVADGFEIESPTLKRSAAIQSHYSKPEDIYAFIGRRNLSRGTEVYLRRKLGTYQPPVKYTLEGTTEIYEPFDDPQLHANVETAATSAFWQAIEILFSLSWFWRLWVFQEIVLADSAVVRWGCCEINWRVLGLAAAVLRTNYHHICDAMKIGGVYNAYLMFRLSRLSDLPQMKLEYLQVLQLTRQFEVTDPRDRVFGLLGIQMEDNSPQQGNLFLEPDYEVDEVEIWKRVAIKIISRTNRLSPLCSVQYTTEQLESERTTAPDGYGLDGAVSGVSPSWVPQWNSVYRVSLSPWDVNENFSASKGLSTASTVIDGNRLIVHGVKIGTVVYTLRYMWHDIDLSLLWSPYLQDSFQTEEGLRLLANTLTAGRNAYGSVVSDRNMAVSDLAAYILSPATETDADSNSRSSYMDGGIMAREAADFNRAEAKGPDADVLRRLAIDGNPTRFLETASIYCERRRLFITDSGFLGLGPDTVVEGDTLAVLAGGDVPFVLRHKKRAPKFPTIKRLYDGVRGVKHDGQYLLVGESYVQGLMNGEIAEPLKYNKVIKGALDSTTIIREVMFKATRSIDEQGSDPQKRAAVIQESGHELLKMAEEQSKLRVFEIG